MGSPRFADVRAVFFDLDDTLCAYWEAARGGLQRAFEIHAPAGWTTEGLTAEWAAAFREFIKVIKNPEWYETYLKSGESTRTEQMRRTLARIGIEDASLAAAMSKTYAEERDKRLRLFDDALDVLNALHGRYYLGLMTNGPADVQRQEIATLGIEPFFDTILIEGEFGEGKPSSALFRHAEKAASQPPEAMLFVGNSYSHDILPAIQNRWKTAWIRRPSDVPPSGSAAEAKPEGAPSPDATIGDLSSLLPMLSG